MQPPLWPQIALQVILLLLTAFFSAAELSIPAQDEGALRRQAQEGDRKAAQLLRLAGRPVRTRATIQLCVTLSGFCSAACAALSFGLPLGRWAVARWALSGNGAYAVRVLAAAGVTLVTALIVLAFGSVIPRRVSLHRGSQAARLTCAPSPPCWRGSAPCSSGCSTWTPTPTGLRSLRRASANWWTSGRKREPLSGTRRG